MKESCTDACTDVLTLVCKLDKLNDVFVKFSYVIKISSSVAEFGSICDN